LQAKVETQGHQLLEYHYERSAEVDVLAVEKNICKKVKMVYAGVNAVDKIEQLLTEDERKRSILSRGGPYGWHDIENYRRLATRSIACVSHAYKHI
jgi:hypothetical protein